MSRELIVSLKADWISPIVGYGVAASTNPELCRTERNRGNFLVPHRSELRSLPLGELRI